MDVLLEGRISLYEPRGQFQLIATNMEPLGVGSLHLALEQLKKRLAAEGLFDEERKRPIPALPLHIGIATSPTGAAIRDNGTKVELTGSTGARFYQEMIPGRGYLSSVEPVLLFGLGALDQVDLIVTWPDGTQQSLENLPRDSASTNRRHLLREADQHEDTVARYMFLYSILLMPQTTKYQSG